MFSCASWNHENQSFHFMELFPNIVFYQRAWHIGLLISFHQMLFSIKQNIKKYECLCHVQYSFALFWRKTNKTWLLYILWHVFLVVLKVCGAEWFWLRVQSYSQERGWVNWVDMVLSWKDICDVTKYSLSVQTFAQFDNSHIKHSHITLTAINYWRNDLLIRNVLVCHFFSLAFYLVFYVKIISKFGITAVACLHSFSFIWVKHMHAMENLVIEAN